jgi:HAE1 family hydrophobic/amphiphilic exporter-1
VLRSEGHSVREAIADACRIRLRPILMTSLATVVGLLPMALKLETGSEAYAPLALAIIGGLASSIVLIVLVVPAAYLLIYQRRETSSTTTAPQEAR